MDGFTRATRRSLLLAIVAIACLVAPPPAAAVDPTPSGGSPWDHRDVAGQPVVDLWFGWSSTCPHCTRARAWLTDFAPTAPWLEVHSLQVDGVDAEENIDRLVTLAAGIGEEIGGVPVFLYAGRAQVGFDEASTTGAELEAALAAYRDSLLPEPTAAPGAGTASPPPASGPPSGGSGDGTTAITLPLVGSIDAGSVSLPVLAVVLGGLDAVNPCALSILLFLVSALVGARARRRIVLVGGIFVLATGIVYFLLMAAWLNAFLWFGELRAVTLLAGIGAIVAGLINVKDFGWFRRGPSLVIPESAKPAIFGRILDVSETVAMPALLGTTVLVAATASAYEMLCTGGFPVVFTRVLTLSDLSTAAYYAYLGLYVSIYVLPMLAIVGVFAITLGSRGLSINEARRLKLLSGLLMLGIGGLLLFAPERLSDLSWTIGLFVTAIAVWLVLVTIDRGAHSTASA
jgi:hypothetical protein